MKKTLLQTTSSTSIEWTPLLSSNSKKEILDTIFENYLCAAVSPDCNLIAILEDKKFILVSVDDSNHRLNVVNEVLLEDDNMLRSTRRFSWSQDSKLFVFTSSDIQGSVRLIGFNRKGRCVLAPTILESFTPFSAITIADIILHNFGYNSIKNSINLSTYNIYIFTKKQKIRQFVLEISGLSSDADEVGFSSASACKVEAFRQQNMFHNGDVDVNEQSLNGMSDGEIVCKVDVINNTNLIIVSSMVKCNNNNYKNTNSVESQILYQSNLSLWSIHRETNILKVVAMTSVPMHDTSKKNSNSVTTAAIFPKDFYNNNMFATNHTLKAKMERYLKRKESLCTQIKASILNLFFSSNNDHLTSYNTRYGIHMVKILNDDGDNFESESEKTIYIGALDFSGNVHIFRFNMVKNDFIHAASIFATKTKYFTNFAWWSRSDSLILLITNLGVIDVYNFQTCQPALWEQTHVLAGHRKLFSMNLGYAGILSRQKSIKNGSYSYSQLQRVNEHSLLETLVRSNNIEKATQLASDFSISTDVIYKSRWKNVGEKYTINDIDNILKPIKDHDWVIESSYNYFDDDCDVISALINYCLELIDIEEIKSLPKYFQVSNDKFQSTKNMKTSEPKPEEEALSKLNKTSFLSSSSDEDNIDNDNSKDGWSDDDSEWSNNDDSLSDSHSETYSEEDKDKENNNKEYNNKYINCMNTYLDDQNICKLIQKRLAFLKYKYRLRCYLHLKAMEETTVDSTERRTVLRWRFFRDCNLVDFAIVNCNEGRFNVVGVLFEYCWEELHIHRMFILDSIPDTCPVSEYSALLPYCSTNINDENCFTAIPLYVYRDNKTGNVTTANINSHFEKEIYNDWIMNEFLIKALSLNDSDGNFNIDDSVSKWASLFFNAHNVTTQPTSPHNSENALASWYAQRAYNMEHRSGQLSNALELCVLGLDLFDNTNIDFDSLSDKAYDDFSVYDTASKKKYQLILHNDEHPNNGFKNLTRLYIILSSLEKLVYDSSSRELETSLSTLSLKSWLEIPNAKKVELIMRSATPEHAVGRVRRILFLWMGNRKQFVSTCERRWMDMLVQYMKKLATDFNGFKTCVAILKSCDLRDSTNAIIREPPVLIAICLHCIYACPLRLIAEVNLDEDGLRQKEINNGLFDDMNDIFNMIPVITEKMIEEFPNIIDLDKKVDRLKSHLDALEILRIYHCAPGISFFNSCETEYSQRSSEAKGNDFSTEFLEKGKELLNNICRKFISNPQNTTSRESIKRLVEDLEYIRVAIPGISSEYTNKILLKHSLGSRFYSVGKAIMENNVLSPNVVEGIVIEAAIDYFNSAAGSHDQIMETAKEILNLAPLLNDDVLNELHLIEASKLVATLGSSMLPLQIRLVENKIDVINRVLQDNPNNYLNVSSIQKLLFLLNSRASLKERKEVQMLLIKTAIREGDFTIAGNQFVTLFEMFQTNGGNGTREAGANEYLDSNIVNEAIELIKNKNFTNLEGKNKLIYGLMLNSPPESITELVGVWREFYYHKDDENCQETGNIFEIDLSNMRDDFQVSKFWYGQDSKHSNNINNDYSRKNKSVNPIGFMLENDYISSPMPFDKSNEVEKAVASALDHIESDDRYRFMLSFSLALSKVKNEPDTVEKYYKNLVSGCKSSDSKEFVLAIACSVFCMASLFCTKNRDEYVSDFHFFHLPYLSLYEQLKLVQIEDVEPSKVEKFNKCKAIATQLAGNIIQRSGGEKDVVGQYMLTHDYMKTLQPEKLVEFINVLTVPEEEDGAVVHPLGVRCAAVDDALRLLTSGTNEYKIVQKIRCRLKAIEEIQAAVAMNEYPLLLECLEDRANELERTLTPTKVKECFVKMACSGVPPVLLTRIVLAYAGKLNDNTTENGLRIPKKIIDFYRVGISMLLKKMHLKHISLDEKSETGLDLCPIMDDELDTVRHDLYLILYHVKGDTDNNQNKPVKDVILNTLMLYCKKQEAHSSEICIVLESFVLAEVVSIDFAINDNQNDEFLKIIAHLFNEKFDDMNFYGKLFIVSIMCRLNSHVEIGYRLLKLHFVHSTLQNDDAAVQISKKYMESYEKFCAKHKK
jgi:hypothetical protein